MRKGLILLKSSTLVAAIVLFQNANGSQETNVEIATGLSCENLLATTKARYGSLVDIEFEFAFAFEELYIISYLRGGKGTTEQLENRTFENQQRISRLGAMHTLFQNPKCPIQKDWYRTKLKIFTEDNWWFTDY